MPAALAGNDRVTERSGVRLFRYDCLQRGRAYLFAAAVDPASGADDYAVQMLNDSVAAGIEALLQFCATANANHTAGITGRSASAVFAPFHNTRPNTPRPHPKISFFQRL